MGHWWIQTDHNLDHKCPDYDQPLTINMYEQTMLSLESCFMYYDRVRSACFCMGGQPGIGHSDIQCTCNSNAFTAAAYVCSSFQVSNRNHKLSRTSFDSITATSDFLLFDVSLIMWPLGYYLQLQLGLNKNIVPISEITKTVWVFKKGHKLPWLENSKLFSDFICYWTLFEWFWMIIIKFFMPKICLLLWVFQVSSKNFIKLGGVF